MTHEDCRAWTQGLLDHICKGSKVSARALWLNSYNSWPLHLHLHPLPLGRSSKPVGQEWEMWGKDSSPSGSEGIRRDQDILAHSHPEREGGFPVTCYADLTGGQPPGIEIEWTHRWSACLCQCQRYSTSFPRDQDSSATQGFSCWLANS